MIKLKLGMRTTPKPLMVDDLKQKHDSIRINSLIAKCLLESDLLRDGALELKE